MTDQTPERIDFNLDDVEREKTYKPFVTAVNGHAVTMKDPSELDWKILLEIESPVMFLRHCVSEEDKDYLREQNIPGWKFGKLIDAYMKHYGLDKQGNGAGSPI